LRDYKSKQLDCALGENTVAFVKGLETVVQRNFASGLTWNTNGKEPPSRLEFSTRKIPPPSIVRGIPKLQTDNSKIFCEFWSNEKKEIECDKKQSVFIFYCINSNISVKGKSSNIIIDGCAYSKVTIVEAATLTISNCHRVEITCSSNINSVTIDKTHGCTLTLPEPSSSLEVLATGSSQLFVAVPAEEQALEICEIPTQIKTKVRHGKLTSTLVEGGSKS